MVLHIGAFLFLNLLSNFNNDIFHEFELFLLANERDHDLRNDIISIFFFYFDRSFHDRTCLHLCKLRIGNCKTASTMTHHRVELMKLIAFLLDLVNSLAHIFCKLCHLFLCLRSELMQRRI